MSTTATSTASTAHGSLAQSAAFRAFATVFAVSNTVLYVVCEMANWPLFTYHPGTDRIDLGWAPAVRDEGPAMYWYGWTATSLIGSAVLGLGASCLPERVTAKIPLSLVWIAPLAAIPVLIYALRFFWRW